MSQRDDCWSCIGNICFSQVSFLSNKAECANSFYYIRCTCPLLLFYTGHTYTAGQCKVLQLTLIPLTFWGQLGSGFCMYTALSTENSMKLCPPLIPQLPCVEHLRCPYTVPKCPVKLYVQNPGTRCSHKLENKHIRECPHCIVWKWSWAIQIFGQYRSKSCFPLCQRSSRKFSGNISSFQQWSLGFSRGMSNT